MRLLCLALLSLQLRSGPPGPGPADPCSLTNILHVQQQIKTDQADCYRSYTGVHCPRLAGPDGLWTPVVFINNSIQLLASRGHQAMLSRGDGAPVIQQRCGNTLNICCPGP